MREFYLRSANLVDVENRAIRKADIRVVNGRFASITEAGGRMPAGVNIIDCRGRFVAPGLIDGHTHTELSLLSAAPFAEMLIRSGTTAAIIDPHDFVNVVGMRGLGLLIREAKGAPLRGFFMAPCCVPSTSGFEDGGIKVSVDDVLDALERREVIGLAEVMDTARLLRKEKGIMSMIDAAKKRGLVIDGHCPSLSPRDESRYFALSGAKTDHESTDATEIMRKHGKGRWIHLRRTSLGKEYPYSGIFRETGAERLMLATDGCVSPVDVMENGHISAFVRDIIRGGVAPAVALSVATINPARCYGLDKEIGSIAPGKRADFVIAPAMRGFRPEKTFINGRDMDGVRFERLGFPAYALRTIKARTPRTDGLAVRVPKGLKGAKTVRVNVIGIKKRTLLTKKQKTVMKNSDGVIHPDPSRDVLKAVVLERHSGIGRPQAAFVTGFGLKAGAFGGSIGQDCQHICVIGCTDGDIIGVIDAVIKAQGGIFYVKCGVVKAGLRLPIGGIMTDAPPAEVAGKLKGIEKALRRNGVKDAVPYLTLSLRITLAAIPELKLTDRGLLDVRAGRFVNVAERGAA